MVPDNALVAEMPETTEEASEPIGAVLRVLYCDEELK